MPKYVRARDKSIQDETANHYVTVLADVAKAHPEIYAVLKEDAVDSNGDPLPGEIKPKETGQPTGESTDYDAQTVLELRAEIDRRNADLSDDDQIPSQGNKPDLIAALQANDKKES